MQGPSQVQDEFGYLLKPAQVKKSSDIPVWIAQWEDRASKLASVSAVHAFPDELRRQVFYQSMPKEVQVILDDKKAKRELVEFKAMKDYIISYGTQQLLAASKGPAPLMVNSLIDHSQSSAQPWNFAPVGDQGYSDEQWLHYFQSEEGQEFAQANPTDANVQQHLFAIAFKGKGKGGKSGGKGFQGNCWGCLKPGHIYADCQDNPNRRKKGDNKGKKGAGKGGKGYKGDGKGKGQTYLISEADSWFLCCQEGAPDPNLLSYIDRHNEPPQSQQDLIGHPVPTPPTVSEDQEARTSRRSAWTRVGTKRFPASAICGQGCTHNHVSNPFEILVVEDDESEENHSTTCLSEKEFPSAMVSAVLKQHSTKKKARPQGLSGEQRAIDRMAKEIEKNVCSSYKTKRKYMSLDCIDETSLFQLPQGKKEPFVQCTENVGKMREILDLSKDPNPMTHIDLYERQMKLASAVTECAKQESDMKVQYQHDQNKKLLEYARADMEYVEQKVSDVSIGGCCMCGSTCATDEVHQKSDKPNHSHVQQDELGKIFSDHIKERTGEEILMLGEQPPELNAVSSKGKLVWVKIATVLDSGACRHVTPNGVFSLTIQSSERSAQGHNYYGPAGDPIKNLGQQLVKGASESGQQLNIAFDVAKITRPLASVSEIVSKDYRVVFDSDGSFLQHKKTGKWIPVRQEGSLYYLDLWCQVPEEISDSPFVRQAA